MATLFTIIKQAFVINKVSLPWTRAIRAGICAGAPVLFGLLIGNLPFGLLMGMGSFTYLYTFNIPYTQRAGRLFFILLGMTLSVGLGTLLAPFPIASAIAVGTIGAIATFVFGALQIQGPAAIFFVLVFLMAGGMPIDPALASFRAGAVFLGGALAWVLGMIGWFRGPHRPETNAVKHVYRELASMIDSIGMDQFNQARQRLVMGLKSANDTLRAGYISWHVSHAYKQLIFLNEQANTIFLRALEYTQETTEKLPPEISASVRAKIQMADAIMKEKEQISRPVPELALSKPSLKSAFIGSFHKNAIVFLTAMRYGFVLAIAAIVAYSFAFNRSYWVTLSCAAVMSGATIIATFHRAIQRSLGTVIGILIATLILAARPEGIVLVILITLLTALTELAIVLNYGIAALFITANALLMAESTTQMHDIAYFASARIVDVLIGCIIGIIGTLLISGKQASGLLPHLMAKTIRSEQRFLLMLFSERIGHTHEKEILERTKMQTNLSNLKIVYTTALGELTANKAKLSMVWPAVFSIEQIGYLLESCLKYAKRPILNDETLSQLLLVFETMATSAELRHPRPLIKIPEIAGFASLQKEIEDLQNALLIN